MRRRNRRVCLRRVQAVLLESPKDVGDSRRMSVQKFEPAKVVDIPTVKRIEELTPSVFHFARHRLPARSKVGPSPSKSWDGRSRLLARINGEQI
ncbi:hypothetical protein CN090_29230 [Sinorhizobium meliloti]|nr:hypothetical protein [Sinorhizobium meliloti]MQX05071.1 hypothetical protein [Sinorhizobium meliloti]RVG57854.1 hypothetical protein CN222_32320 [Sinorhizobium meliloti]RVG90319.1 hypothetical protein CN221_24825 [Sinorhizobium meliloti]RVH61535.1 hypothetical protein CN209_22930 [Sinorhizobium meliloti]